MFKIARIIKLEKLQINSWNLSSVTIVTTAGYAGPSPTG